MFQEDYWKWIDGDIPHMEHWANYTQQWCSNIFPRTRYQNRNCGHGGYTDFQCAALSFAPDLSDVYLDKISCNFNYLASYQCQNTSMVPFKLTSQMNTAESYSLQNISNTLTRILKEPRTYCPSSGLFFESKCFNILPLVSTPFGWLYWQDRFFPWAKGCRYEGEINVCRATNATLGV